MSEGVGAVTGGGFVSLPAESTGRRAYFEQMYIHGAQRCEDRVEAALSAGAYPGGGAGGG